MARSSAIVVAPGPTPISTARSAPIGGTSGSRASAESGIGHRLRAASLDFADEPAISTHVPERGHAAAFTLARRIVRGAGEERLRVAQILAHERELAPGHR